MPWGIAAGVAGSVLGSVASSAISGGGGGGGSSGGSYSPYIGAYQPQQDQAYYNNYNTYGNTLNGYYGFTNPLASQALMGQYNNPQANNYQIGAAGAQNAYYGAGAGAYGAGTQAYNNANSLLQAANNWDSTGAVKANLEQQAGDTANAQSYLRGIQNSPYGAAVATNAINQADLGYANTQLQNQISATQASGQQLQLGNQLQGAGAGYYGTGASLPYTAANSISQNQFGALNNYYGTLSPYLQGLNQLQGNALQYLGYGNTSQNTAAGQASQAASTWGNLGYQAGNGIYQGLQGGGGAAPSYGFTTSGGLNAGNAGNYDYYGSGDYSGAFGY